MSNYKKEWAEFDNEVRQIMGAKLGNDFTTLFKQALSGIITPSEFKQRSLKLFEDQPDITEKEYERFIDAYDNLETSIRRKAEQRNEIKNVLILLLLLILLFTGLKLGKVI